jgi:hypothetical protein
MLWLLAVFLSGAPRPDATTFPTVATPLGPLYRIEGAKHPEAIPDWMVWRHTLRHVARTPEFPAEVLGLTAADVAALTDAASGQAERDAACQARHDAHKGAAPAEVRAIDRECHGETLAAVKELLAALSPDGAATVARWLAAMRAGTIAYQSVNAAASCLDATMTNLLWLVPGSGVLNPPRSYAYVWTERQPQACACTFWLETRATQITYNEEPGAWWCYPPTTADWNGWGCWDLDGRRAGCEWQCQPTTWPRVARVEAFHVLHWGPPGDPRCAEDGLWLGDTVSETLLY